MENPKKDIFDKMMALPVLRIFEPFYLKHKSILLYLFFGGLSFVLNIVVYYIFNTPLGLKPLIANIIAWIAAVAFAYVTNKIWVFESETNGAGSLFNELMKFLASRIGTLIIEELILYIFIEKLMFNSLIIKIIAQIIVILLNYVFSKLFVFKTKNK
ncbi:MAG: GtrA family protein [Coprococcus sp.]